MEGYKNNPESFYTPPDQDHPSSSSSSYYNNPDLRQGNHHHNNHMLPPPPHPIQIPFDGPSSLIFVNGQPYYPPPNPHEPGGYHRQEYLNGVAGGPGRPPKPKKPKKEKPDINRVVDEVISQIKTEGTFDKFRRECLSESDTKPSYINLHSRVTTMVDAFLRGLTWTPGFAKPNARNQMRKRIEDAPFFKPGIENIVEQCLRGKMGAEFVPIIEEETFKYMGCDKKKKNEETIKSEAEVKLENGQNFVESSKERPFQYIGGSDSSSSVPPVPLDVLPPPPRDNQQVPHTLTSVNNKSHTSQSVSVSSSSSTSRESSSHTIYLNSSEKTMKTSSGDVDNQPKIASDDQSRVQVNGWNQEEKDDEEMETCSYEDESFVEEEESEDESPMFEKIGEVSPPRPVYLENSEDILRELEEEARRNSCYIKPKSPPPEDERATLTIVKDGCKYLEPPPLFKEKLAYYKKLPECGLDK